MCHEAYYLIHVIPSLLLYPSPDINRGILFFWCIHKLYDYVLLDLSGDQIRTSDIQFTYKSFHFIYMCTDMFKEIIYLYVRKNINVYYCLLDASKAIDRVHYEKVFNMLLSRYIHPYII